MPLITPVVDRCSCLIMQLLYMSLQHNIAGRNWTKLEATTQRSPVLKKCPKHAQPRVCPLRSSPHQQSKNLEVHSATRDSHGYHEEALSSRNGSVTSCQASPMSALWMLILKTSKLMQMVECEARSAKGDVVSCNRADAALIIARARTPTHKLMHGSKCTLKISVEDLSTCQQLPAGKRALFVLGLNREPL